ncbi:hypothetical protein EYZ11_002490 [Aspergillus tanneri]|uniref:Uncharacterized protein n=1 Tax=Aspergillus tanneri TaxID=1220188 RepID=A0A4V3UQC7_9EURO|nr:hypothetical protein EYZ11_002490 [Aspergillus tanneri]
MPPTFRSSRSGRQFGDGSNRTRTGQIDHDVFEGLPVRRWTRQSQTISQVPKMEDSDSIVQGPGGKQSIPEHPMPRDSHLLTPMSRALLRAARAGCVYIRPASKDPGDEEKEVTDVDDQPLIQSTERSFVARKWSTVPKHLESMEVEFLAKRRPGLSSLYGAAATGADGTSNTVPMRRTRFQKVDPATGNISIYEAWVPEGHKIEGEVTDEAKLVADNDKVTITPEAPAPGTVIEGVGVVNAEGVVVAEAGSVSVMTPPKRRPPPPKRKAKGFGKGRRKKVMFAPGDGADSTLVHGSGSSAADGATGTGRVKEGDTDASRLSVDQSGQDDEDEDGEEGEESEDGEGDESMPDAKTPETPGPQGSAEPEPTNASTPEPPSIEPTAVPTATPTETTAPATVVPEPPSEIPSQAPTVSTILPAPEIPSLEHPELSASAAPEKPAQEAEPAEDVEMTDDQPQAPVADDTNQPAPANFEASEPPVTMPHTEISTVSEPIQLPEVENADQTFPTEKEPLDVIMTEQSEPVTQKPVQMTDVVIETSMGPAQEPEPENVRDEHEPKQPDAQPEVQPGAQPAEQKTDGSDIDLLGSLEASLGNIADQGQVEEQSVPQPEKQADAQDEKVQLEEEVVHVKRADTTMPEEQIVESIMQTTDEADQPSATQGVELVIEQHSDKPTEQAVEGHVEVQAAQLSLEQMAEPTVQGHTSQPAEQNIELTPVAEQPAEQAEEQEQEKGEEPKSPVAEPIPQPNPAQETGSTAERTVAPTADRFTEGLPSTEELKERSTEAQTVETQPRQSFELRTQQADEQANIQSEDPAPQTVETQPEQLPELPTRQADEQANIQSEDPAPQTVEKQPEQPLELPTQQANEQVNIQSEDPATQTDIPAEIPHQEQLDSQPSKDPFPPAPTVTEEASPSPDETDEHAPGGSTPSNLAPIPEPIPEQQQQNQQEPTPEAKEEGAREATMALDPAPATAPDTVLDTAPVPAPDTAPAGNDMA